MRSLVLVLVLLVLSGCALPADAPAWEEITSAAPPERWGHAAVYDPARERMLVFGGDQRSGQRADVWALDLEARAWSELETLEGPGPRSDLANVLDVERDRWIVIGGRVGLGRSIDEVWSLDLGSRRWSQHAPGPSARHDVSAASDGARAWVFGGAGQIGQSLDDLWELDLETLEWRELPRGEPHPVARTSYAIAYYEGALYLHGGHDILRAFSDTWRFDLATHAWSRLEVAGDAAGNAHPAHALDVACGAMVLAGGDNLDGYVTSHSAALVLERARFEPIPVSVLPPPRDHATLVIDRARRAYLYGGGALGEGLDTWGDTWVLELGGCP